MVRGKSKDMKPFPGDRKNDAGTARMASELTRVNGSTHWMYIMDSVFWINQHTCASSCGIQDRSMTSMLMLSSKRAVFEVMARVMHAS